MTRYKVVVVGTGFIGPVHVEGLQRAGVEVAGIVGSSPEKSRQAAQRLGLPETYPTFAEALQDPAVDSIHITTPNRLHYEQVKAVLAAGKHCLCEKPLTMNSRQSAELVQLAADSGLATAVAYNIRFYPLCHEATARVASGAIGDLIHVNGSYVQDWLLKPTDFNWRVLTDDGGPLRAVADIGTHWLDLVQSITGQRVVAVFASLRTVHEQRFRPSNSRQTFSQHSMPHVHQQSIDISTEDCGAILLQFDNGSNGSLWVSQVTAGRKNCLRFELAGTTASLEWNSEVPNQMWIGHRDQPNELLLRDPSLLSPSASRISSYPAGHNEGFPDTFKQLFKAFYGYIAAADFDAAAPFPSFADGHQEVLLCEAILTSHREQRWVEVTPVTSDPPR